jgi:hypothetical protein
MNLDTYESFSIYFWAYINENIISDLDRDMDNKDFCDSVCYDCFRMYSQSNISIDEICKIADNILFSVKRYQPILISI